MAAPSRSESSIEMLEARIAPAAVFSTRSVLLAKAAHDPALNAFVQALSKISHYTPALPPKAIFATFGLLSSHGPASGSGSSSTSSGDTSGSVDDSSGATTGATGVYGGTLNLSGGVIKTGTGSIDFSRVNSGIIFTPPKPPGAEILAGGTGTAVLTSGPYVTGTDYATATQISGGVLVINSSYGSFSSGLTISGGSTAVFGSGLLTVTHPPTIIPTTVVGSVAQVIVNSGTDNSGAGAGDAEAASAEP